MKPNEVEHAVNTKGRSGNCPLPPFMGRERALRSAPRGGPSLPFSSFILHPSSLKRRGFTLAEILAAMVFVAVLVPVALEGLQIANRAGVMADRRRTAAQLADRLLTESLATESWRNGDQKGDFGEDGPGYRWLLETKAWEPALSGAGSETEGTMRAVSVEVFFLVQEREYSARLTTLVEDSAE